jgi:hypothetical protein
MYPNVDVKLCDANARDLGARLLTGDLEAVIYALPGEEPDERTHSIPLFVSRWCRFYFRQLNLWEVVGRTPVGRSQRGVKPASANWFSTSLRADHMTPASSRP